MVRGGEDVLCGAARVCLYVGGTQAEIAKAWTRAREEDEPARRRVGKKKKRYSSSVPRVHFTNASQELLIIFKYLNLYLIQRVLD